MQLDNRDATRTKGNSPCPVSGVLFAWTQSAEAETPIKDKDGNISYVKGFAVEDKED